MNLYSQKQAARLVSAIARIGPIRLGETAEQTLGRARQYAVQAMATLNNQQAGDSNPQLAQPPTKGQSRTTQEKEQ